MSLISISIKNILEIISSCSCSYTYTIKTHEFFKTETLMMKKLCSQWYFDLDPRDSTCSWH